MYSNVKLYIFRVVAWLIIYYCEGLARLIIHLTNIHMYIGLGLHTYIHTTTIYICNSMAENVVVCMIEWGLEDEGRNYDLFMYVCMRDWCYEFWYICTSIHVC